MARVATVAVLVTTTVSGADSQSRTAIPSRGSIRPEWIESHVRFLADPLLEGRETGTRGGELAARYVASQLEALGLAPLGKDGNFLLPVPLRVSRAIPGETSLVFTGGGRTERWQWGREYFLHADKTLGRTTLEGGVVFVGFGVSAPEYGYDDYRGVDVRGKFVAMFFGGPEALAPDQRGYFASFAMKEEAARSRGALGVMTILPAPGRLTEEKLNQLDGFAWLDPEQKPHSIFFELGTAIRLADSGAVKLFAVAGRAIPEVLAALAKGPASFPIDATIRLDAAFEHRATSASNAGGLLVGSDPRLAREYLVYSAHLDHVGVQRFAGGDSVHYGAIDNAGGTAAMLAIARAFTLLPRPRRSVIFLAVTGEEKGILGSDYFAAFPPVDAASLVANVNLDNFVMIPKIKDLVAYGAGYSSLADEVAGAFRAQGIASSADPLPWMTIFTRSDHYAFMRRGVPGVMLFPGKASGDGTRDGTAVQRRWFDTIHHTPGDRIDQGIDWAVGARYAETNLLIGQRVANAARRPTWRGTGQFFLLRERGGNKAN